MSAPLHGSASLKGIRMRAASQERGREGDMRANGQIPDRDRDSGLSRNRKDIRKELVIYIDYVKV